MFGKAILLALWAGLCSLDDRGPQLGFRKALPAGAIAGLILGDFTQGLMIAATLEIMWMGIGSVGAYTAPDVVAGSIVGVALGILSGGGVAAGVALAVPAALLCQQLLVLWQTVASFLVRRAERISAVGNFDGLFSIQLFGGFFYFLVRAVPVFLTIYLGSEAITSLIEAMPAFIITGLTVSSKIIPAVGIAMLLTNLLKGQMWVFLLLGFTLAAYVKLPLLAITFIAIAFAFLYDLAVNRKESELPKNNTMEEEDYDL